MVTNDILYRVLRVRYNNSLATVFTITQNGVQYIVTARHIFNMAENGDNVCIELLIEKNYESINATVWFDDNPNVDCAVLKTNPYREITNNYTNENTLGGITLGQDVYFLGFPYNYDELVNCLPDRNSPVPFIKKACLSGISENADEFYLDGINNPGFSGGPVCFKDKNTHKFKLAGIISGYRFNRNMLYANDGTATNFFVEENTGIIKVCNIARAISIIEKNVTNALA